MPNQERIEYLFQRYLDRMETPEELDELMDLVESGNQKPAIEQLLDKAQPALAGTARLDDEQTERLFQSIRRETRPVRRIGWMVAAAVIVALSVAVYLFNQPAETPVTVIADIPAPTSSKATIKLADGRIVALDSITSLTQGDAQLTKTADGQLIYTGQTNAIAYNTLTNPKASQVIDITLGDGSRVWLNAGSSITYPVGFVGKERKVEMSGEAYFEVSKNKTPFIVVVNDKSQVEVLGTHFNVNAYVEDESVNTTLLEGSVRTEQIVLQAGQQAVLVDGKVNINEHADLAATMAWKNGLFEFNETNIQTIMKQIERWYDVQVVFEGQVTQHFNGTIQRKENVSKVLHMLEKTGGLKFSINGKTIKVSKG